MLYSYSYGAITSFAAMYAEASGSTPKGIYLTVVGAGDHRHAAVPRAGWPIASAMSALLVPCLVLISVGLLVLVSGGSRARQVAVGRRSSAPATAPPTRSIAAYLLQRVNAARRGAAFGALIAAFDTGIGTGSLVTGWIVGVAGYQAGFGVAAALSALSIPYFFAVRRVLQPPAASHA